MGLTFNAAALFRSQVFVYGIVCGIGLASLGLLMSVGPARHHLTNVTGEALDRIRMNAGNDDVIGAQLRLLEQQLQQQGTELLQQRSRLLSEAETLASLRGKVAGGGRDHTGRPNITTLRRLASPQLTWRMQDRPQLWQQRTFEPHGSYGFVQFSAYRISRRRITIVGFTRRNSAGDDSRKESRLKKARKKLRVPPLKRKIGQCVWYPCSGSSMAGSSSSSSSSSASRRGTTTTSAGGRRSNRRRYEPGSMQKSKQPWGRSLKALSGSSSAPTPLRGAVSVIFTSDNHDKDYEVTLLECSLSRDLEQPGGTLQLSVDNEVFTAFRESPHAPLVQDEGQLVHELAVCGAPMFGSMDERMVVEWMEYHHAYIGVDYFFLYDAGAVDAPMLRAMHPFFDAGLVTITEFLEGTDYHIWAWAQQLALYDCGYAMRGLAKWIAYHDFDEYIQVVPPHVALKHMLRTKYAGMAWLSHGTTNFSIHHCKEDNGNTMSDDPTKRFLVSPLPFRERLFHCFPDGHGVMAPRRELCSSWMGYRKFIANPRKVSQYYIHSIKEAQGPGVDLDANVVRHAHYRGLAAKNRKICRFGPLRLEGETYTSKHEESGGAKEEVKKPAAPMMVDTSIASIVAAVIACRNATDSSQHECTLEQLREGSHGST